MKRYSIADYLSGEAKRSILAHRFLMRGEETDRRDADGLPILHSERIPASADDRFCPLAYLPGIASPAPSADEVAEAIRWNRPVENYFDDDFDIIADAASQFIEDWDAGRIPPAELAAALGTAVPS